jgi:hypothetical protein
VDVTSDLEMVSESIQRAGGPHSGLSGEKTTGVLAKSFSEKWVSPVIRMNLLLIFDFPCASN